MRIARSTHKPAKKVPNGQAAARKLLSEVEVTEGLRLEDEDLEVLRKMSRNPGRNAAAQLGAIRARLEYSHPKPKIGVEHSGSVTYELVDPFAKKERGDG